MQFARCLILAASIASIAAAQEKKAEKKSEDQKPVGVPVRFAEGSTHGFLQLSTPDGKKIAGGDLIATIKENIVTSRMEFHFADSSFFQETVSYGQAKVFALHTYHLIYRGPAFPYDIDARLDRNGHYVVVTKQHDKDGKDDVDRYEGNVDMPADVYNGMIITVARNLGQKQDRRVHILAFTPKPRMIELEYVPTATDRALTGTTSGHAVHFVLKPRLGTVTGFFAKLTGKMPPDSHAWIIADDVPAFLRFEGTLVSDRVWRIEQVTPQLQR